MMEQAFRCDVEGARLLAVPQAVVTKRHVWAVQIDVHDLTAAALLGAVTFERSFLTAAHATTPTARDYARARRAFADEHCVERLLAMPERPSTLVVKIPSDGGDIAAFLSAVGQQD